MAKTVRTRLRQSLGLFQLSVYGIGTIIGAGIYSVIAPAAAEAGDAIWIGFGDVEDVRRIVRDVPRPMIGIPRRPQITPRLYGEMGYKIAVLPGVLPTAAAIGIAGALQALKETDSEVPFYESIANSAEIRAWCGQIGAAKAEDLLKRHAPIPPHSTR